MSLDVEPTRPAARLAAWIAVVLIGVSDLAYLAGLMLLGAMPQLESLVNVALRLGPIWTPAIAYWVAAVITPVRRLAVVLGALGVTSWAVGDTMYDLTMGPDGFVPTPGLPDIGYLGFYLFMLASLAAFAGVGSLRSFLPVLLDGAIASLGAASVLLVVVQPVIDAAQGQRLTTATVVAIAYPVLDVVLLAVTVGIATHPRLARIRSLWWFLVGVAVFVAADVGYALLIEKDAYGAGGAIDFGWPLGLAIMALSVLDLLRPDRRTPVFDGPGRWRLLTPGVAVVAALGVLLYASMRPVGVVAVVLAAATVALTAIPVVSRQALLGRLLAGQRRVVDELRTLDSARTEMVATLNHELRTPLTSILGYVELVRDGDGGPISERADGMLDAVEQNARRLNAIVDEMVVLTRIDAHALDLRLERVDVGDVARRIVAELGPVARQRGIALTLEVAPDVPQASADAARLGHALTTLVENAIKFTPNGGLVTVSVATRDHERPVVVTVRDTGVGVPPDDLPHLFERFYRASNARASAVMGSGLGLSIAQGIVDAHGGRIRAESVLGAGTAVVMTLPAAG